MQITGGNGVDLGKMEPKLKLECEERFPSSFAFVFGGSEIGEKCGREKKELKRG